MKQLPEQDNLVAEDELHVLYQEWCDLSVWTVSQASLHYDTNDYNEYFYRAKTSTQIMKQVFVGAVDERRWELSKS